MKQQSLTMLCGGRGAVEAAGKLADVFAENSCHL